MLESSFKKLLVDASVSSRSAWAIVRNGAVAEFCITPNDIPSRTFNVENNTLTEDTSKACLKECLEYGASFCSVWV